MLSEEFINHPVGNCETPTLKTPRTVSDDFVESTFSAESLISLFEMENTPSPLSSPAMEDCFNQWDETSSLEDISSFVKMLKSNSDKVKLEAASALLHVLSINHASTVVECGAIPALLDSLQCPKQSLRDECVKCIRSIVSFSSQLRDYVVQMGGLSNLVHTVSNDISLNILLEAISAFFNHEIHPSIDSIASLLPCIVEQINQNRDPIIIVESCKVLSRLADGCPKAVQLLLDLGTKRHLMRLLNHEDEAVVVSALRTCRYLVPPKDVKVLSPQDLPVSPIRLSTPRPQTRVITDQWKISPLMSSTETFKDQMQDLDILICKNVEMFKASEEDTLSGPNSGTGAGALVVGQLGLRCIHCGTSPFARGQFSTVFPGSISSIPASLRHMAIHHLPACLNASDELKTKVLPLVNSISTSYQDQVDELERFCSNLCSRAGVQNRYPPRSGLAMSVAKVRNNSNAREPKVLRCNELATRNGFKSESPSKSNKISMPVLKKPKREMHPSRVGEKFNSPHKECKSTDETFVQMQHGLWRCIVCLNNQAPNNIGTWNGSAHPSSSYCQWHAKEYHGTNARPQQEKVEPILSDKPSSVNFSDIKCSPVSSNNYAFDLENNSSFTNADTSEKIPNSRILVQQHDKEFLTPFTAFVLEQLEACYLGHTDQKRYNFPLGFPGIRCKHCVGMKCARKFFWTAPDRFKNNSSEFSKHLLKCQYCPKDIKERMNFLKSLHQGHKKLLKKGGQMVFYKRLFNRLHHKSTNVRQIEAVTPMPPLSPNCSENIAHSPSLCPEPSKSNKRDEQDLNLDHHLSLRRLDTVEDSHWLDTDECFLRQNIGLFCITSEEINEIRTYSQNLQEYLTSKEANTFPLHEPIITGQVGLRCIHCLRSRVCRGLSDQSAFKFLSRVEETRDVCTELHHHLSTCPYAPKACKNLCMKSLSKPILKATHQYYINAAYELGLYNEHNVVMLAPILEDSPGENISKIQTAVVFSNPDSSKSKASEDDTERDTFDVNSNAFTPLAPVRNDLVLDTRTSGYETIGMSSNAVTPSAFTPSNVDFNEKHSQGSMGHEAFDASSNAITPSNSGTKRPFQAL